MARTFAAASNFSRRTRFGGMLLTALALASCNGGTGNERDSGTNKTTLSVQATDTEGDALHYSWRVTAGTVDNVDKPTTVWTLPDGSGLHFAYVTVYDGKGGYVEQQYAVSSDAINNPPAERTPVAYANTQSFTDFDGTMLRLRFRAPAGKVFAATASGGTAAERTVYMPDVQIKVVRHDNLEAVFTGVTDVAGEISLPKLPTGVQYDIKCATSENAPLDNCGSFTAGIAVQTNVLTTPISAASNLRLFGHVALADGSVCGIQNDFYNLRSAATVQLQAADGTALTRPVRVNRFGDYALDAAVPVRGTLKAVVTCEGYSRTLEVPAAAAGYSATTAVELSHVLANSRPQIVKMVANGPEGNVRGKMVVPLDHAASNNSPGADHYLTFKGRDTALSACMYYRALGAVQGCGPDGALVNPITLDDWKRARKLSPYTAGNQEVSVIYINKMDLNLVRRMAATSTVAEGSSFVVCNNPGPEGTSQVEINDVVDTALRGEKLVACVAMEWSTTPGVNGGRPYTKFLTFGPDGRLLPSVNLDGRGEKYLPGACVACHGGTQYAGRFPDRDVPSPAGGTGNAPVSPNAFLGSGFLGFDTGNYLFSSAAGLTEADQGAAIYSLNALVAATEPSGQAPINRTFAGWYPNPSATKVQNKDYVPTAWGQSEDTKRLYREVIGQSCRTCHAAMNSALYDWDSTGPSGKLVPTRDPATGQILARPTAICGGTPDVALNGSMPNALITRDRIAERVLADPSLAQIMTNILGCTGPAPDPVYPRR
jgi:hypothetical protein